jgi:hypothetical protein
VALLPLIVLFVSDIVPRLLSARRSELLTVDPRMVTSPPLLMVVEWLPSKVLSTMSTTPSAVVGSAPPPTVRARLPGLYIRTRVSVTLVA